ncbi:MAG: hypothetical protein BRC42_12825 [Cyanobacteria bacterium QS_1_48_34]|nr:MAG: hypothetical protein BRC42_12825 [Cyanobacteria bacterium QS_1_48_34]
MNSHTTPLTDIIAKQIAATPQQRITFAHFMDLALYHPQYGYYSSGTVEIGSQGDFFTSTSVGADLGELLAEQFVEMWEILGHPRPFTLVEMGAGQGLLAADILHHLQQHHPDLLEALNYVIVEQAAALITQQRKLLQPWIDKNIQIWWRDLGQIPQDSITGCFFSNELVDALPVHRVAIEQGQLREIYVTTADKEGEGVQFVEVSGEPSTPRLEEYFQQVGINLPANAYPDGYRTEVNLVALDWLATVANCLQRGYVLTIDYGYAAQRYYTPQRREGTLQCYYQHRSHDDPYTNIGHQDITAHIDWTALEHQGKRCGLQEVGFTKQGMFLMALGLGDRLSALSSGNLSVSEVLQRRDALHQLIDPAGLGGFGVLVQSGGLSEKEQERSLQGFQIPDSP